MHDLDKFNEDDRFWITLWSYLLLSIVMIILIFNIGSCYHESLQVEREEIKMKYQLMEDGKTLWNGEVEKDANKDK